MANEPARPNPYADPDITFRNVTNPAAPEPLPAKTGNSPGRTSVYTVEDADPAPDNSDAPAIPHVGNSWRPGRDPYANQGGVGQDFLE